MKKWSVLLVVLIFCSCWDENSIITPEPEQEDGYVSLKVKLPGVSVPASYALSEESENHIQEIDVLVFEKDGDNERFSYKVESGVITDATDAVNGNKKTFRVKLKRTTTNVRLVVLANSRNYLGTLVKGELKADVLQKITFDTLSEWPVNASKPFPMWGETSKLISINVSNILDDISLIRAVAKIDVGVDLNEDPSLGFGNNFKMQKIFVYGSTKKGCVIPNMTGFADNKVSKPNVNAAWGIHDNNSPLQYSFTWDAGETHQKYFQEIYIPESEANQTFLVVSAYYDGSPDLSYYRLDFVDGTNGDSPTYLPVLRNHRYLVNISGLKNKGFASAAEAAESRGSNLVYSLSVTDELINDITYNGQYLLGVNTNYTDINGAMVSERRSTVSVYTTYDKGWKAVVDNTLYPWLTATGGVSTGGGTTLLTVIATNLTDTYEREGVVKIIAGNITKEITVRQRIGANTYITSPNTAVYMPVAMANADGVIRLTEGMNFTPKVIWQSENGLVTNVGQGTISPAGFITVTPLKAGNLVVGIFDDSNELIWSWHVWSVSSEVKEIEHNNKLFMDRNLGALGTSGLASYGYVYQWGRKDPFPGASATTVNGSNQGVVVYKYASATPEPILYTPVSEVNNINKAIKNPTTFYISDSYPYYSWAGTGASNNLLWDRNGKKSPYDPCPNGWRVPASGSGSKSPWYGLTNTNGGSWNDGYTWNNGFYPAAGGRDGATGSFTDIKSYGYIWSATAFGYGAYAFKYGSSSSSISASSSGVRANAYPVRCVKE